MKNLSDRRLLLADDHAMIRMALRLTLENNLHFKNIEEASSCSELLSMLNKHAFTHLVTDLMYKDGSALEIMSNIRALFPKLRIMVCSQLPKEVYFPVLQRHGVTQYAEKSDAGSVIEKQLKMFLSDKGSVKNKSLANKSGEVFGNLSQRELEVLHYLLHGNKMVDIAAMLNISNNTVYTLKSRIMEKTGATSMKELYDLAKAANIST